MRFIVSDEPFDRMLSEDYTSKNPIVYKTGLDEHLYVLHGNPKNLRPKGWSNYAEPKHYIRFIEEGKRDLEAVFGKGSITAFVWPYSKQGSPEVIEYLKNSEYTSVRKTGTLLDSTNFDMPSDRMEWTYNATHSSILSLMEKYEQYVDDGKLKFFSFGVHSVDFENGNKWGDLLEFAKKYGNRPEDFYYATVGDIFAYEDAVKSLKICDGEIINESEIPVYIKIDGERVIVRPKCSVKI